MYTEDRISRDLRSGAITLEDVMWLFERDLVAVYPPGVLDKDTMKWDEREEYSIGSTDLFPSLRQAGATEEQLTKVAVLVKKASDEGRTL